MGRLSARQGPEGAIKAAIGHTVSTGLEQISMQTIVDANSTSSTTFKVRMGGQSAGTLYFNGDPTGGGLLGGAFNSYIKITEIAQ